MSIKINDKKFLKYVKKLVKNLAGYKGNKYDKDGIKELKNILKTNELTLRNVEYLHSMIMYGIAHHHEQEKDCDFAMSLGLPKEKALKFIKKNQEAEFHVFYILYEHFNFDFEHDDFEEKGIIITYNEYEEIDV